MSTFMYRVRIIEEPQFETRPCFDTANGEQHYVDARCPVDWYPNDTYIARFGTDKWIEPDTSGMWRSRSSAALRRDLLNAAGYIAIVQRSAPVVWPTEGQERVPELSDPRRLRAAVRELAQAVGVSSDVL
ncbi:hypothetical protein M3G04_02580 [Dietzia cinnamea]|uniref:hypothetical protein n=1 Tax=Dietzia cinnamea TaxID=321318 RepID=UPI00223AC9C9|nr:hypothetical protein [Dietzia cinnamea]MCT2299797.1 hypothetical protein [Dietzia cinnamea]